MRARMASFLALALLSGALISIPISPASATGNTIFTIAANTGLKGRPIDGTGSQSTIGSVSLGVEIEASGNYIYISYGSIRRINTDGTGLVTLRTVADQYGILLDGGYIYYGYQYTRKIGRMNLDGSGANDSWLDYSSNTSAPYSAQMVIVNGILYFGGGDNSQGKTIWKVPLSGGTPTHFITDADQTAGIRAIDSDGTYIYWSDRVGEIGRVALDGSGFDDNWISGLSTNWGMQVADDYIYFIHWNYIGRVRRDGTGLERTWVGNTSVQGLAIADAGVNSTSFATPTNDVNSFALASNASVATYRTAIDVSINVTLPSRVTFMANGKRIGGCINKATSGTSPNIVATCSWSPSTRGSVALTALIDPNDANASNAFSNALNVRVGNRTNKQ